MIFIDMDADDDKCDEKCGKLDNDKIDIDREIDSDYVIDVGDEKSKKFEFVVLCDYLDKLWKLRKAKRILRKKIFDKLIEKYSMSTDNATLFPLIRLIINNYDQRKFFMKSVSEL